MDLALAWCRIAMRFCCSDGQAGSLPKPPTKRPAPRYMCYHDLSEDLVKKQLEFRKLRKTSRSKGERTKLTAVGEGHEDRARWMRIAACMLLQTYVRALRAADEGAPRAPAYQRAGWCPPSASEFEERVQNLKQRFPELDIGDEISTVLDFHGGHGGYAASALLQRRVTAVAGRLE